MKNIVLLFLFVLPCSVCAQNEGELFVSEMSGAPALLQVGREKTEISKGQQISNKDILVIADGSTMILLEPRNCDRYTLKGPFTGNIVGYMKRNEQNSVRHISKTYFNFLFSRMLNPGVSYKEKDENSSTSALRKGDSILISGETVDSLYHVIDSLSVHRADTTVILPADPDK